MTKKSFDIKRFLLENNIAIVLIILFLYAFLAVPFFGSHNNLYKLVADFSMYGIVALGMTFLLISGEIDLSLGMIVAISTISSAYFGSKFGAFMGITGTLICCIIIGLINGLLVVKLRIPSLIATIGTMNILTGLGYLMSEGKSVGNTNEFLRNIYSFRLFDIRLLQSPVILFIVFLIVLGIILHKTRFGNGVFVIGGNEEAGYTAGINIEFTKIMCFIIAAFCAGITGILMSSYTFAGAVAYGDGLNITIISACVIGGVRFTGGKGSALRTLLGIIVVRTIMNISSLLSFDSWAQNLLTGGMLVLVLIIDRFTGEQKLEDAC